VNWSEPPCCTRLHGTATRLPLDELLVDPMPELVEELLLAPMPVDVELLVPGDPAAPAPLSESTTNWICPLAGSNTTSRTVPRCCPDWPLMVCCINLLRRMGCPIEVPELAPRPLLEPLRELVPLPGGAPLEFEPDLPAPDFVESSCATAYVVTKAVVRQSASALRTVLFIAISLLTSWPRSVCGNARCLVETAEPSAESPQGKR
jgi:hypothetical protein